jgi:hypothetical protein
MHDVSLRRVLAICGICAIIAAIVGPVIAQGRDGPGSCMARNAAIAEALALYMQDQENRFVPGTQGRAAYCDGYLYNLLVWPEILLPYHGDWHNYRCPQDPNATDAGLSVNICTGAATQSPAETHWAWSLRSNRGYNWQFLSPTVAGPAWPGGSSAEPLVLSRVNNEATTLAFADSIWERTSNGAPLGGGCWVVDPPCTYNPQGGERAIELPPVNVPYGPSIYWVGGWNPGTPLAWNVYGGVWPWHPAPAGFYSVGRELPTAICTMVDGHIRSLSIARLGLGCDVRNGWQGRILDHEQYIWDLK